MSTTTGSGPLLAQRHVARLLLGTLIGRLPNGMAPVAILLLVADQGGALKTGGLLCALYGLASAVGQPVLGRMVDRRGQTLVTAAAVLLTTVCLLALSAVDVAAHVGLAAGLVALAGLSTPPLEAGLRALWPVVLPDEARRRAALALDTGTQGLIYVTGPPLVAVLSATTGPRTAIQVTAALGLLSAIVVLSAAPSRHWRPAPAAQPTGALGPLAHPGLRWLFVAVSGVGFALGAMNVWAVALADDLGMDLLSGLIPAALSTGSVVGGFLYGRRTWPGTPTGQLLSSALLFAAGWLPVIAVAGPISAVTLTAVPGLLLTAVITSAFLTVDALAPAGTTTEAYAWLIAAVGTGQAAGTALSGALAEHPPTSAALPAVGAVLTFTVLLAARRHLAGPGATARRRGRHRRTPPAEHRYPQGNSPMAVRTSFEVAHTCGHTVTHNLSDRPADKRASFARWLTTKDCTDCWKAVRDNDSASKEEWVAAKRAAEQQAAADWAAQFEMPPLEGPQKALDWGERSRHQLVTASYTALVTEGTWDEADWDALEEKIRTITRAGWWIDQRDAEGTDLPELLDAATEADRGTENPFR